MPIYEYKCQKCGHQLEALQSISDQPLCECPVCHEPSLNKLISSANFHLKGTGWYVTDFRDKGSKPANQSNPADQSTQSTGTPPPSSSASTEKSDKSSGSTESGGKNTGTSS